MDELSHWDAVDSFTAVQVASLIAGIDPLRENLTAHERNKVDLVSNQIQQEAKRGTARAFLVACAGRDFDDALPKIGIQNDRAKFALARSLNGEYSGEWVQEGDSTMSRSEVTRWLQRRGIRSAYSFDLPGWNLGGFLNFSRLSISLPARHTLICYEELPILIAGATEPKAPGSVLNWAIKIQSASDAAPGLCVRLKCGTPVAKGTPIGGLSGLRDTYVLAEDLGLWMEGMRYKVTYQVQAEPVQTSANESFKLTEHHTLAPSISDAPSKVNINARTKRATIEDDTIRDILKSLGHSDPTQLPPYPRGNKPDPLKAEVERLYFAGGKHAGSSFGHAWERTAKRKPG